MDRLIVFILRSLRFSNQNEGIGSLAFSQRHFRLAALLCVIGLAPLIFGYIVVSQSTPPASTTPTHTAEQDEQFETIAVQNIDSGLQDNALETPVSTQDEANEGSSSEQTESQPPSEAEPTAAEALTNGIQEQTEPIAPERVLVQEGQYYQRNGDYDRAVDKFKTVIDSYAGTPEATDSYLALAETHKLNRQFKASIETLQEFLQQFPFDGRVERAMFFIANNYRELGEWGGAIYYYEHYAERTELLRGYAYLKTGDSYFQQGDFGEAIESFRKVLDTDVPRVPRVTAMEKIGDSYFWLKQYQTAVSWYREALTLAVSASYKADLLNRVGMAHAAAGDAGQAEEAWSEVIENYPSTQYALKAVESLPEGRNPPTHYYQGLVYYNNDRYDAAIAAFNEYLRRHPDGEDVPRTHYYLALCYRYKGDYGEAFSRLDEVVKMYPDNNIAGDALWQAGRLAETLSRYEEAILLYGRVANEYPSSEHAKDAIFRKGLSHYRLGDFNSANATWEMLASNDTYRSKARFWAAKASSRTGDQDAIQRNLEIAMAGGNEADYYVAKSKALLSGNTTFGGLEQTSEIASIAGDSPDEKMEFEYWLASWSGRPFYSYDENNLLLRSDAGFRRAEELIRVGSWNDARDEFTELRQKYASDPVALYELAMFFRQNGLYYPSISTAMDIARLSPGRTVQGTPKFLQKLVYPIYYRELLLAEAARYSIDPLLLASLIRQESIFDQNAESPATAKGLTQVMPSTGRGIANSLGMTDFEEEDLFKPYVSVAFGAWYFWNGLKSFDSNVYYALAAYNAGGGSIGKWIDKGLASDDDLFVEDITYSETQSYVKKIYQQYEAYREIYAPTQTRE